MGFNTSITTASTTLRSVSTYVGRVYTTLTPTEGRAQLCITSTLVHTSRIDEGGVTHKELYY